MGTVDLLRWGAAAGRQAVMSDPDIFAAGVGVALLFLGGVYVVLRESFLRSGDDEG